MKKIISIILLMSIILYPVVIYADDITENNLKTAKEQTLDALKELKNAKPPIDSAVYHEKGSAYSDYKTSGLGPEYYKKTAESPYTKSKIAQGIAAVAETAVSSIGTAMQQSAEAQLTALAADLMGSGVPEYQTMATQLNKEAGYIATGDSIDAKQTADGINQFAAANLPVDLSYKPTSSETAALSPFAQFFEGFLGSVCSALTQGGFSVLTAALGTVFGPLGSIIGASAGSIVTALVNSLVYNYPVSAQGMGMSAASGVNSGIMNGSSSLSNTIKTSATPSTGGTSNQSSSSGLAPVPVATQVQGSSNTQINNYGTDSNIIKQ
jgi:hypothetical protein